MQFLSVEVNLTRDQVIVYNTSAHVWYVYSVCPNRHITRGKGREKVCDPCWLVCAVLCLHRAELKGSLETALHRTGAAGSMRVWNAYWATHQRFFKQLW